MQHTRKSRARFRLALLAACVGLAMSSLANAQVAVTSLETDTVKGRAPVVATATITGTPSGAGSTWVAGDVLTAAYTLNDPDGDDADAVATDATIQWTSDGVAVGTIGSKTYTLQASDAGKVITYTLVPHTDAAITDPYFGTLTIAANVGSDGSGGGGGGDDGDGGEITPAADNLLLSVALSGDPLVAGTLTATPTCIGTCTGNITYQWQLETGNGTGVYADIAGQTGTTYTPVKGDQRREVKVVANQPAL
ncbi:ZirU family protein [Lysobacter sp. KIS68-7]|uniref:ZirU family protein n=1 Tax=Lysobacter sp. KIS68-7 TaxID=2904252 RepID=UPI001E505D96|nr:ZirU family protein [Lysobacter sp. KIS68-7]UHQ18744.1 ZirU family protein [Lysobacter sp. KIS68-7]